MKKYLVVKGNEQGVELNDVEDFKDLNEAEDLFSKYLDEYGCAAMYEVLPDKIVLFKKKHNF